MHHECTTCIKLNACKMIPLTLWFSPTLSPQIPAVRHVRQAGFHKDNCGILWHKEVGWLASRKNCTPPFATLAGWIGSGWWKFQSFKNTKLLRGGNKSCLELMIYITYIYLPGKRKISTQEEREKTSLTQKLPWDEGYVSSKEAMNDSFFIHGLATHICSSCKT